MQSCVQRTVRKFGAVLMFVLKMAIQSTDRIVDLDITIQSAYRIFDLEKADRIHSFFIKQMFISICSLRFKHILQFNQMLSIFPGWKTRKYIKAYLNRASFQSHKFCDKAIPSSLKVALR